MYVLFFSVGQFHHVLIQPVAFFLNSEVTSAQHLLEAQLLLFYGGKKENNLFSGSTVSYWLPSGSALQHTSAFESLT